MTDPIKPPSSVATTAADAAVPATSAAATAGTAAVSPSTDHTFSASMSVDPSDHDGDVVPETLALMIPIAAVVLALTSGMLRSWLDYRRKREAFQLHHAERMAAIEKGVDVPPLPPEFFQENRPKHAPSDNLRSGLTALLVGIAIVIALRAMNDAAAANAWWGLVPAGYGLARIIFYFATSRAHLPAAGGSTHRDS